jgi:hypothetical protein
MIVLPVKNRAREVLVALRALEASAGRIQTSGISVPWITRMVNEVASDYGSEAMDETRQSFLFDVLEAIPRVQTEEALYKAIEKLPPDSELLRWLATNVKRLWYVEDKRSATVIESIRKGWKQERAEVCYIVLDTLQEAVEQGLLVYDSSTRTERPILTFDFGEAAAGNSKAAVRGVRRRAAGAIGS